MMIIISKNFVDSMLILHAIMGFNGDDIKYAKVLTNQSLVDYINYRYYNWSSQTNNRWSFGNFNPYRHDYLENIRCYNLHFWSLLHYQIGE